MSVFRRLRAAIGIGVIPLLFAVVACSSADERSPGSTARDSAGVRIVESVTPLLAPGRAWTVSTQPILDIGAVEGDSTMTLHHVEAAIRTENGRIVIANGAPPGLRWYDSTGAFVQGTGRYGQGPGEFDGGEGAMWIYALWPLGGDTIGTWEHSRRRMQVFDPQARYVRAMVIDLPPDMPRMSYPQASGRFGGGVLAFYTDERDRDGPLRVVRRDSLTFVRYANDGKFARQIARLPGFVRYMDEIKSPTGRTFRGDLVPPFSPVFVSWPDAGRLYYGAGDRYEIAVYDTSGTVRALIRRPVARRVVTDGLKDRFKQSRLEAAGNNPELRRRFEEELQSIPYPDSLPAIRRVRVDRAGMLWVQQYTPTGSAPAATWSIFDRDGRWVTDLAIPTSWQITDIGRDYILAIETDDLDVEHVRMYRLQREPRG